MGRTPRAPRPDWAPPEPPREEIVLTRPAPGKRAFGYQLACTRGGALKRAVQLFWQLTREERYEDEALALEQQERLTRALASCDTQKTAQGVMELHLVIAAELRPTRHGYRATGKSVFFGRQHELAPDGVTRLYVPKERQRGLTERLGACVRTLQRYWAVLRDHGVWASRRPSRTEAGAVLTRSRSQVYTQRWLVGGTPQAVRDQLPLRPETRPARPPQTPEGVRMRADELAEALVYLDGADVPY